MIARSIPFLGAREPHKNPREARENPKKTPGNTKDLRGCNFYGLLGGWLIPFPTRQG